VWVHDLVVRLTHEGQLLPRSMGVVAPGGAARA